MKDQPVVVAFSTVIASDWRCGFRSMVVALGLIWLVKEAKRGKIEKVVTWTKYIYMCAYIYIYIERERESVCVCLCVCEGIN